MALQNTETSCPSDGAKSFFSVPPHSLKRSRTSKLLYQYEFIHIADSVKIQDMQLPDINLYKALTKPSTSFFKSFFKIFLNPPKKPKESIQVTQFDQHPIPSGEQDKFITLNVSDQFPTGGCTHVHVGVIRLALTFHGKKGLPVSTRIALLDSRYKDYHHACVGIVETTLNSGTVVVTMFPNFTMSLKDRNWSTAFLVQIQIVGVPMDTGLVQATLYSQMAYRFQDHVYGLGLTSSGDIPLIQIDSRNVPTTIHIPTSISRQELVAILPEAWISNYENRLTEEQKRRTYSITRNANGTATIGPIRLHRN